MREIQRQILFIFGIAIVLQGCKTAPAYHADIPQTRVKESILVIKPVTVDDLAIVNIDDFKDDWPELKNLEQGKHYFIDLINKELIGNSKKLLLSKRMNFEDVQIEKTEEKSFLIPEVAEVKLDVPVELNVDKGKPAPDFVLVLDNLIFNRKSSNNQYSGASISAPTTISTPQGSVSVPGAPMMTGGSAPAHWLDLEFEFVIWDLKENKAVSYGKASSISQFIFAMDQSDWERASSGILSRLLRGSKLKKRRRG